MIQLRPGDLVAVERHDASVLFAILTKQVLFGGHWSFVFHGDLQALPSIDQAGPVPGFNAAVDFLVPKREGRVSRLSRRNDFSSLMGPKLLKQPPLKGETNYRVFRWTDGTREDAEFLRFTPTPTQEEKSAPHYSCIPADWAHELALRGWEEHQSMWSVLDARDL